MDFHLAAYYIGILIVFATHAYMLYAGVMTQHAYLNLAAAFMIAYYFMSQQGMISV